MAENRFLLHTYHRYANKSIDMSFIYHLNKQNSLSSDIANMQRKELAFYKKYGANSFQEFRQNITKLFTPADKKAFQRFEAENLSKALKVFSLQNRQLYEYSEAIQINVDFSQVKKINGLKLSPKAKPINIIPKLSVGELKKVINDTFERKFHTTSDYSKQVDALLLSLIKEGVITIDLGTISNNGDFIFKEQYQINAIPNFPWGLTKDIYERAEKDQNQTMLREIKKAIEEIYRYLYEELGKDASSQMKQAIQQVWQKHFYSGTNPALFFSGGKTTQFISGVQGALGEFQTALLFEYLSIKGMEEAFATIKGNTRLENTITKEQARTDVEIFQGLGIQVKNFVTIEKEIEGSRKTQFLQDIHTRIHPEKLSEYFPEADQVNFLNFMANYYFNATYEKQQFNNMIKIRYSLEQWIGAIMNMAVKDAIEDTVTFYMIGGKLFVPCSVILEASQEMGIQQSLKIYSSFQGHTDEEFAKTIKGESLYSKYWQIDRDGWSPTQENEDTFKNLISNRISIQTNFNFFDKFEDYVLWE